MDKDVILVGGFHEVIELCEKAGFNIVGIIDGQLQESYFGYPVIGSDADAEALFPKYGKCKLVITPDSPRIREKLVNHYEPIGYDFATIISPSATISKFSSVGKGAIIQDGVNVSACTTIGNYVKLNTNANVMHDNTISDYVTIAPNAVNLGRITVGRSSYIGANATVLPEVMIGNHATVGAGAVVIKNVPDNTIVKGVPAK